MQDRMYCIKSICHRFAHSVSLPPSRFETLFTRHLHDSRQCCWHAIRSIRRSSVPSTVSFHSPGSPRPVDWRVRNLAHEWTFKWLPTCDSRATSACWIVSLLLPLFVSFWTPCHWKQSSWSSHLHDDPTIGVAIIVFVFMPFHYTYFCVAFVLFLRTTPPHTHIQRANRMFLFFMPSN